MKISIRFRHIFPTLSQAWSAIQLMLDIAQVHLSIHRSLNCPRKACCNTLRVDEAVLRSIRICLAPPNKRVHAHCRSSSLDRFVWRPMDTKTSPVAGKPTFPKPANKITCLPTLFRTSTAYFMIQGYLTGVMATDVP